MQMAAPLAIGLLGWYAWYETGSKFWLFDIYFFTGVATLAKGPVARYDSVGNALCGVPRRARAAFAGSVNATEGIPYGLSHERNTLFVSP